MSNATEIARSIIEEIESNGPRRTYQQRVVRRVRDEFGEEWSYKNQNGNWAIHRSVLKAMAPMKDEHIVWDRSDQSWRVVTDEQLERIREREALLAERRAARLAR